MKTPFEQRRWLVASMTGTMRQVAAALVVLNVVLCLALALCAFLTRSPVLSGNVVVAASADEEVLADQVQEADEDADTVPGVPVYLVLGITGGVAVTFLAFGVYRVNHSISDMSRRL